VISAVKALRKDLAILPFLDIRPAALHEVAGQLFAQGCAASGAAIHQLAEFGVQQAQQVVEGLLVARVRCRRQQDQVALRVLGQSP
jgi:hypothetical protein